MKRKAAFKKRLAQLMVVMLAVTSLGLPAAGTASVAYAAAPAEANLDFEAGGLTGWTVTGTAAAQASDVHGGLSAAKLSAANTTLVQTLTGIEQGSYTLSAWVKGSASSNSAYLTATNTGGPDNRSYIDAYISSTAWTQISIRNVLVYNGQVTLTVSSGSGTNLLLDDIELTLDSSDSNPVVNWNMEAASLSGWTVDSGTVVAGSGADTGSTAAVLSAGSQISQVISVTPNTDYVATVRAKVDKQDIWQTIQQSNYLGNTGQLVNVTSYGDRVNLGVKDLNGTVLRQAPAGTAGYALLTLRFKTGPGDHQVTLYANTVYDENYRKSVAAYNSEGAVASHDEWSGNGSDKAYVDNFDVFEIDNTTLKGADVSFLPVIEDNGGKYFANGVQQDCLTILANHGVNSITGMLFVHAGNYVYDQSSPKQMIYSDITYEDGSPFPYTMQEGYFDKTHAYALAKRAKDLDMSYLPSFHFSDGWMSAGKAYTPLDWMYKDASGKLVDQTLDEMTTTMYNYVYDFIKGLQTQGTPPVGVKIGNEQDGGIAWPNGKGYKSDGFKALINAAYDAVHDAAPGVSAYIHSNNGYNPDNSNTIFGTLRTNGVKFDGQAYSLYSGHPTDAILSMLTNNLTNFPDQDYLDVETGYAFTKYNPDYADESGSMGQATYYAASNPNGQYNWLLDYMQALRDVANPHDRTRGFYYWETDWIVVEGAGWSTRGANTVDRRTMFNNGDISIKEMGSTANGKMGDMMDSMYAYLWRGHAKTKASTIQSPLKGYGTYSVTKTSPMGITLDQTLLSLSEGTTRRLLPSITPAYSSSTDMQVFDSTLVWTSSNPGVATVNAAGYVTAVAAGTAQITATTEAGGVSASSEVTVTPAIQTGAGNLSLTVGGSTPASQVNAKVWDQLILKGTLPAESADQKITYNSSNPEVAAFLGEFWQSSRKGTLLQQAKVTQNVKLNVIHDGTTVITATSGDGTAESSFTLNVSKIPVTGITLNKPDWTVSLGRTAQLSAAVAPANASFGTVKWTSSDPLVAAVSDNGLVTTVATGTTIITATSEDDPGIQASCTITVVPVMVTGLTLSKPVLNLMIDSTKPIIAILAPEDAYNQKVIWSSSDPATATVDASGNVTGHREGSAILTAVTDDGGFTQTATVNVQTTPVAVTGVTLDKSRYYFASDYFSTTAPDAAVPVLQLTASVVPEDATNTELFWTSNNPTIAAVDAYGKVTALKAGTAVITATAKEGGYSASTSIYVPAVSESFDNRTAGDNWAATAGSAAAYSAGVATPAGISSQVFALSSTGSGARAEYKSFAVSNNLIVLNFDWNMGAPATGGTGQLRIQDSAHNNYITFGVPTGGTSSILYDTSAAIAANTPLTTAGTAHAVSTTGFKTANSTYNVQVSLDMTAKQTSFTITSKADPSMTATVNGLPFATGTAYKNNLGYLEFYTTRASGGSAGWSIWLDNFNVYTEAPEPVSVSLDKPALSLLDIAGTPGNTAQLTAVVHPDMNGIDQTVTWKSSDPAVATVSSSGLVTAIGDGTAVITAASAVNTDLSATSTVNVHPIIPVEAIGIRNETGQEIDETTVKMNTGESMKLEAALNPGSADYRSIVWSTSDSSVATIESDTGLLTTVGPGEAVITLTVDAYQDYGGYAGTKTFTLEVQGEQKLITAELKTAISAAKAAKTHDNDYYTQASLAAYQQALAAAETMLASAIAGNWDYSHQSAVDLAAAELKAAVNGLAAAVDVPVTAVLLSPAALSVPAGKTAALSAEFTPAYATETRLSYTSSDDSIAAVDSSGRITALAAGTAVITATTQNGKTATSTVTVTSDLSAGYLSGGGAITASATKSGYDAAAPVTKQTAWTSGGNLQTTGTPVYWQINLGQDARIDNVKMNFWQTMKYSLQVSVDGLAWTTAVDHSAEYSGSAGSVFTDTLPAQTIGKYIRLMIYGVSTTTDWVGMVSFQANGAFVEAPATIAVNLEQAVLAPGGNLQLQATLTPLNANPGVSWTSSDSAVAAVTADGLVTAVADGTALIKAASSNGLQAVTMITVASGLPVLKPETPTGLTARAIGSREVDLKWDAVPGTVSYSVYRAESEDGIYVHLNPDLLTEPGYADSGLAPDTTYYYSVSALNAGGESERSLPVQVRTGAVITVPSPPAALIVTAGSAQSLIVSWTASPATVSYDVYRMSGQGQYDLIANVTGVSFTDTALAPDTEYIYIVKAVNEAGVSEASAAVSGRTLAEGETPLEPPVAPVNLVAQASGTTTVLLAWTEVAGSSGYNVYRSLQQNGDYTRINSSLVADPGYNDSGLQPGTKYYYKVTAVQNSLESEASGIAAVTTMDEDNNPVNPEVPVVSKPSSSAVTGKTGTAIVINGGIITVTPSIDPGGNGQLVLSAEDVKQALASGSASLTIRIPAEGSGTLRNLQLTLPVADLVVSSGTVKSIVLELSGVTLTLSTLASAGILNSASKDMRVSVSVVDPAVLSEEARAILLGHPVYDFNLAVDGQSISRFTEAGSVSVKMNYTLQAGEKGQQLVVYSLNADGTLEVVKHSRYDAAAGTITFLPQHFSRYAVAYVPVVFTDLGQASWAASMIESLAAKSILSGTGAGQFTPGRAVTRAEFLQMLLSALDLMDEQAIASFSDVKQDAWYYQAVATAQQLGIAQGDQGAFNPEATITREDMAVLLSRAVAAAGVKLPAAGNTALFGDQSSIAGYAASAVADIREAGLISGFTDGTFAPKQQTTRAQAAAVIYRLLDL